MNKFQYTLGWLALAGGASILIVAPFVILTEGWNPVLLKLVWMPFVSLWGLRQVRIYRYEQQIKHKGALEDNDGRR